MLSDNIIPQFFQSSEAPKESFVPSGEGNLMQIKFKKNKPLGSGINDHGCYLAYGVTVQWLNRIFILFRSMGAVYP